MQNTEPLAIANGGIQIAPPILSTMSPQIIYLDFDGAETAYHNRDLDINIENVEVEDSGLTEERIAEIVKALNDDFTTQNVIFVTERPEDTEYSTIYFGKTSSFDQYGKFAGLAETIDVGNAIKSDNAFVMLDATSDNSTIVETISHEAQHLIGILEHEGEGISRYAEDGYIYYYYLNNLTFSGTISNDINVTLSRANTDKTYVSSRYQGNGGNVSYCLRSNYVSASNVIVNRGYLYVSNGGIANSTILSRLNTTACLFVFSGGIANNTTIESGGYMVVSSCGIANNTVVNSSGALDIRGGTVCDITVNSNAGLGIYSGGTALNIKENGGYVCIDNGEATFVPNVIDGINTTMSMTLHSGTTANNTILLPGARMGIYNGGEANSTTVNSACRIYIFNGGFANDTIVNGKLYNSWGNLYISSGGVAINTIVNSGGDLEIYSGGTANTAKVNGGGRLYVTAGGKAHDITVYGGGYVFVQNCGLVSSTIVGSGGRILVSSGGIAYCTTVDSGVDIATVSSGGTHCGTLQIASESNIYAEAGATIDFTLTDRSPEDACLVNDITRIKGYPKYTITINAEQGYGLYRLAGNAAGFKNNVTLTVDGTNTRETFTWQDGQYNPITVGSKRYSLVKSDDELCLNIGQEESIEIKDFETLKLAVSSDWQQYSAFVELPGFSDGWGRQTNHRHWASISVTNASIAANGTSNQVDVTLKAKMSASLGIITIQGDISGDRQGLFLTLNKVDGDWEYTKWDLIGTVGATLQQVDRRQKFHLFNTPFDPKEISVDADINTREGVYVISWKYKKSGYGLFQDMSITATLKQIDNTTNFDMSSISLRLADDPNRVRINSGFHIYEINLNGRNLSITDDEAPEFSGSIGFTWMSASVRLGNYAWLNKLLDTAHIAHSQNGTIKLSVIDTKLSVSMNFDGDFKASGNVNILSVGGNALANIYGEVTYSCKNERLTVLGTMDLLGMANLQTTLVSVKNEFRAESKGAITIPGWARWLSGYSLMEGHAILYSTMEKTVISIWGELHRSNGTYSVKGYSYNLTTGKAKDISNQKDIDNVYIESGAAGVLAQGETATATWEATDEDTRTMSKVIFQGSYANSSDALKISICNEATGDSYKFSIAADYTSPNSKNIRSGDSSYGREINVAVFDEHGFSIEMCGVSAGTWKVEVQDNGAALSDFDLWLEYESSDVCQLEAFSVTDVSLYSVGFFYSIIGGNDETAAELYCRRITDDENDSFAIFLDVLAVGKNQSYTWTQSSIMDDGEYEFFMRLSGDFIPFESEAAGCFVVDNKKLNNTIQVVESAIDDGEATILHPVFSVLYERYEMSYDNENWQEIGNDYVLTTYTATEFYIRGYDADSEAYSETIKISLECPVELISNEEFAWRSTVDNVRFRVKLISDAGVVYLETSNNSLTVIGNRDEQLQGRVQVKGTGVWTEEYAIEQSPESDAIHVWNAVSDGSMDVFMTTIDGQWGMAYQAQHVGVGAWAGTNDYVALSGKNVIADIFAGSNDASLLLLTDDDNGDALFVDDIYSALPDGVDAQARIAKIDEIRAGAGNDLIDLTSQRFAYEGGGLTVRGGLGDDVIWANNGDNWLFGDAGDDRLVGADGNDVLVGGIGDDTMHGGGGDDIFAFGLAWGKDTVEQLATGKVTLWFASGDDSKWNDETLTYTDGDNSVKVIGVANEDITRYFGEEGEMYADLLVAGAFDEFTSEKIFEDRNKGLLA